MDERQKLRDDLERYRTLRDLITDEPTIEVIKIMIKERKTAWPTLRGGGAIRMARIAPEGRSILSSPTPIPRRPGAAAISRLLTWPYSGGWGYYPSGGAGLLLVIVIVLLVAGRI